MCVFDVRNKSCVADKWPSSEDMTTLLVCMSWYLARVMHVESKAAESRQSFVPLTCTQNFEDLHAIHAYMAPFCMSSCITPLSSVPLHRRCSASALMSPRRCYSFTVPDESSDSGVLFAEFALNRNCFAPQESSFRSISLPCTTVMSLSPWLLWSLR